MRNTALLLALALSPCTATRRLVVRHEERTSSAARVDTEGRLRAEIGSLAGALGQWFELSGVPPASRAPLARAFLRQEADRLGQRYGDSAGMRAFRRYMPDMLPTGPLFPGSSSFLDGGAGALVTESAAALQDGRGRVVANVTRCAGGSCETTSRIADTSAILETMQRAGPDLPGALREVLGDVPGADNETLRALADLADAPESVQGVFAGVFGSLPGVNGTLQVPLLEAVKSTDAETFEGMVRGMLGDEHLRLPSVWTTTRVENGHAVRETKTCTASGCTTGKQQKFDVPAGGAGGLQLPTHDL